MDKKKLLQKIPLRYRRAVYVTVAALTVFLFATGTVSPDAVSAAIEDTARIVAQLATLFAAVMAIENAKE